MILIVSGRFIQYLLMFATIKISTTVLPPSEMARLYLINSIFLLLAMVFINPVGTFINRRLNSWNASGRTQQYLGYFWRYLFLVSCVGFFLIELIFKENLIELDTDTSMFSIVVIFTLITATVNQTVIPGLNLLGDSRGFILLTVMNAIVSLIASIALIEWFAPKAEYWQSGLIIGYALLSVGGWHFFYKKLNPGVHSKKIGFQHIISLLNFSVPVAFAVGLVWIQSQSYRFFMEASLGLKELGLFAVGYGISASLIAAFEAVFLTYLQPRFYKNISNESGLFQERAWNEYAGAILPSLILFGSVIYATAIPLTQILLGRDYWSSSQFIVWGVVAEVARVASGIFGMVAHAKMRTRVLVIPSLAGALLSIAMIWWLIPIYGANGVGLALICSSLTGLILTYATTHNLIGMKLPGRVLAKSILMGAGIVILSTVVQFLIGGDGGTIVNLGLFILVGATFLYFQYLLLRPLLHDRLKF